MKYFRKTLGDDVIVHAKKTTNKDEDWLHSNGWTNWDDVSLGKFNLVKGFTYFKLECISAVKDDQNIDRVPNIDKIDVITK